jgi:hypothetical protein
MSTTRGFVSVTKSTTRRHADGGERKTAGEATPFRASTRELI